MKRVVLATAAVAAMALVLMASDSFQLNWIGPRGGVIGGVVKNAPYSGEEVTTQDNTLGDGTKIHNESHTKVYRDAEGRTRRESEDMINIYDPVAGVAYVLNPKTMTGRQMKVSGVTVVSRDGSPGGSSSTMGYTVSSNTFVYSSDRVETVGSGADPEASARAGKLALDKLAAEQAMIQAKVSVAGATEKMALDKMAFETAESMDKIKADTQARVEIIKMADGTSEGSFGGESFSFKTTTRAVGKKEPLGTQVLEGLVAEGIRNTSTLEAGAIGNDRPINIVSERWMSGDLKTVMLTKHSDPRSGEEVFRLTNVNRGNPDASLFQLPSGYTLAEERRK